MSILFFYKIRRPLYPGWLVYFFSFFGYYKPGTGNCHANVLTFCLRSANISSFSLFLNAWSIYSTICFTSSSLTPLVVIAGIPIRSPDGRNGGLGSSGIVDLEVEIQILSNVFSAIAPSIPSCSLKSRITI